MSARKRPLNPLKNRPEGADSSVAACKKEDAVLAGDEVRGLVEIGAL